MDDPSRIEFRVWDVKGLTSPDEVTGFYRIDSGFFPDFTANCVRRNTTSVTGNATPQAWIRANRIAPFYQENVSSIVQKSCDDGLIFHRFEMSDFLFNYPSRSTTKSANSCR